MVLFSHKINGLQPLILAAHDPHGYPPKVGALGETFAKLTGQALWKMRILHRYMGKGCSLQPFCISTVHGRHVTY
jgi:hypothetical protein